MKKTIVSSVLLISSALSLTGCGDKPTGSFAAASSSGSGNGGGGSNGGTIQSTGIFISMIDQDQPIVSYLHQFYNFNLPCTIAPTASSTDMQCLLNVRELDLYDQGLKMQFNVPAGMCDYVSDYPYWYFNRRAGTGATSVNFVVDDAGASTCTVKNNANVSQTTSISGHVCSWAGGSANVDGTVKCAYDYSAGAGPNCCEGSYSVYAKLTAIGSTTPTIVSTTGNSYGGSQGLCAAGPWLDSESGWKFNAKTGYPWEMIRPSVKGFNQYYTIKAPIKYSSAENAYAANFWDWTSYAAGALAPAALPSAMKNNPDDLGQPTRYAPNPAYVFNCYDQAMEVKHRIKIYVNEWDTGTGFLNYGVAGATSNSPVGAGTCDVTAGLCDDVKGWSQYPTSYPNYDFTSKE